MKFPNLPPATALTGFEIVPLTQGGVDKRSTVQAIADANEGKSVDIASAATTDIGAATAPFVHVTGTTTITGLGSVQAGTRRIVTFDAALTLTHNATSLILPTGSNITTAANDVAVFVSEGAGDWRCVSYAKADGTSVAGGAGSGDVIGPASSVDNTLPRFNGTGGKTIQSSGVAVTDNNEISGYRGHLNQQTGTTYTLQASDSGKIVECTNAAAITVTLPDSLAVGFCCTVVQGGAGQVTVSAGSGATLRNRQTHGKIAGQWGAGTLYVRTNSGGSAAEYVFAGDTAA